MIGTIDFARFKADIAGLPAKPRYEKSDLLCETFRLFRESGGVDVYYAPFHRLNPGARVVLIGLTPGWTQMELAFRAAKQGLTEGLTGEALFDRIETTASFGGPMRANLVQMLDGIGINHCLSIQTCAGLFLAYSALVQFTSAVSAPIFKNDQNYTGQPPLLSLPKLTAFVIDNLGQELAAMPDAVVIPLGKVASEAIEFLHQRKLIRMDRCLMGFPHPSGANGHRKPMYEHGSEQWREQLQEWFT
ncbi:MAG: uracil-DNA glycosylase family protein [Candidatus Binataceae bacterium]